MTQPVTLSSGVEYYTGLIVPSIRPMTFAAYADEAPMLTRTDIESILYDSSYIPRRERFPGSWIGNQGNTSSCNGFAGAKALERSRVMRGSRHVKLSGYGLYAQISGGRDAGSMLDDGMHAMEKTGVPPEDMVNKGEYRWDRVSPEAKAACARYRAVECYRVDTDEELASGLALGYVGVVAVHVSGNFDRLDSEGRVAPSDGPGNHAVCVDDVRIARDGTYEYDMPNSWGTQYGENGRGWLSWDRHFRTPSRYHAFYLIRSSIDDPDDDNPPTNLV